jgi:polysaccharide export outer membrane protein
MGPKLSTLITLILSTLLLCACSGAKHLVEQPENTESYDEQYAIGVSDQLSVAVWKYPDLSVQLPVRPDGKISVPLIGDVLAAGFTPETLAINITKALQTYIRNPQVTVLVTMPSSTDFLQRVRVTGAVQNPISTPYRKGMTVLDLVLIAGGTNDFAAPSKAKLYRKNQGITKIYPIYLDDILNKGKLETNYDLRPSDVVTIPERSF